MKARRAERPVPAGWRPFAKLCRWGWVLALLLPLLPLQAEVRLVGSDLLGPGFNQAVETFARQHGLAVKLDTAGSAPGWRELQAGRADLGVLSFDPGVAAPGAPYAVLPLAAHAVVVAVSEAVPLTQISFPQLAAAFGPDAGDTTLWKAAGATGAASQRKIAARVLGASPSLLQPLFQHLVLSDRAMRTDLAVDPDMAALVRNLAAADNVIALLPEQPPVTPGLRVLPVAATADGVAYAPTPQNIQRGDYPLRWPVYLVFRQDAVDRLYPLLRYLLGGEAAAELARAGLVPVTAEARDREVFGLGQP